MRTHFVDQIVNIQKFAFLLQRRCFKMLPRLARQHFTHQAKASIRCFSEKHRDIESFKKQKTEYSFGGLRHEQDKSIDLDNFESQEPDLTKHPSLANLRLNSPDYKQQLFLLQKMAQREKEKQRSKHELFERFKAIGLGAAALVGIITTYQIVMNYKYIKTYLNAKWYHNWDDSYITNLNDPLENTNNILNMIEKFNHEVDETFISTLKPSETTPGLYIFGAVANKKYPVRVPGFDSKYFIDVLVKDDFIVAIDEKGDVYQYSPKLKEPVKIKTPTKMSQVVNSGGNLYFLSHNKKDIYFGFADNTSQNSGWFGKSLEMMKIPLENFKRGEMVHKIVSGENHILILSSKGRLFEINTSEAPINKGQYGLPDYSPTNGNVKIPSNILVELKNLNYEIVLDGEKRLLQPRIFNDISAGLYYNVAVDSKNNLWAWGDNSFGQCGIEASTIGALQAIPKLVYSLKDLRKISQYSLPDKGAYGDFNIRKISCADETTLVGITYVHSEDSSQNQDLLLSFGNGLKGQLGVSRYIHKIGLPIVVKSLVALKEYDTVNNKVRNVGAKEIVSGGNHTFVVLDNAGISKDVLVFGENLNGQFGNGKSVKSSKPLNLPKLLEPSDFEGSKKDLIKKVTDQSTGRLQLLQSKINGQPIEQVLAAGENSSAIYYKKG